MNKKIVILILVVLIVFVAGAVFLFSSLGGKNNAPSWVSSDTLIKKGDIVKPGKILEVVLNYDEDTNPNLSIKEISIKNGFVSVRENANKEYDLNLLDAEETIIKTLSFSRPGPNADIPQDLLANKKSIFVVTVDWVSVATKLQIIDVGKTVIISKSLEDIEVIDNKPNFKTINQKAPDSFQPLVFLTNTIFSIPKVFATGDGYLDIVFVGERFPTITAMESQIVKYKTQLEDIEPFKSRKPQLRYHHINVFNGSYCVMQQGIAFPSCDLVAVEQAVNDASVPADKIIVLLDNNNGAFAGSSFTGFSRPATRCCLAIINTLPYLPSANASSVVFVHELGHLLGGLADEYQITASSPPNAGNCYEGSAPPNSSWQDMVALRDYRQRCSTSSWYRSYEISIMDNTFDTKYFNAPSQKIINTELDTFAGSFTNTNEPTASISSPSSGANVSGVVTVQTSLSDDLGIARANLYVNGTFYQTAYISPFSFSWDTTEFSNGSYTLEVKAFDVPGNTKSATITVIVTNSSSGGNSLKVTVKKDTDQGVNKIFLNTGKYSITEDILSNWKLGSVTCDKPFMPSVGGAKDVTVESGKTTICTFINLYSDKGSIKVVKKAVGGNETFTFDGNFGVSSLTTTAINNGTASQTIPDLLEGDNYYISEIDLPEGWEVSSVSCDNSASETADGTGLEDITVIAGETTICTFTNTYSICTDKSGDDGVPFVK